uniref:P-granule scaffold protein n=1 Tax=Caenorhabditis japonica TaxID=281687 RepID=UPI000D776050
MDTNKREIVEFLGIRTYFFPNLALYAVNNDELLVSDPNKANSFAAYVFGASDKKPSVDDIVQMLFPSGSDSGTILTSMDTLLALGPDFLTEFKKRNQDLARFNLTHDLSILAQGDEDAAKKKLNLMGRKAKLQKTEAAKILAILIKTINSEENYEKFTELSELCGLDLDFDAYVFTKILGLEDEDTADEVEVIRDNFLNRLDQTKPKLADIMRNGP